MISSQLTRKFSEEQPVFRGTRVPVKTLFECLENNYSLDEFLECFPSVTREMARRILERSESAFDQNIRYQQNLAGFRIAILELSTNDLRRIEGGCGISSFSS